MIALAGQVQALTQVINDPAELRAAVAAIQPGDSRGSFGELARYLRTVSEGQKLPLEVHLASDLQKVGHAARIRRSALESRNHAGVSSSRRLRKKLGARKCSRASPRLRSQAREVAGYRHRFRHARGQAHCDAAAQWARAAIEDRGRARKRPRASGVTRPRRPLRVQQGRSAHRRGRQSAGRRPLPLLGRARRSPQGPVHR